MTIALYDFQARGLDEGRAHYRAGSRAVLFVGPTGMGKTTLASAAAVGRIQRGGRVVAIAHRRELVDQMAARLAAMGLDVGARGRRPSAPVQVVSVQTLLARGELPPADFVILDEAHHYVSDDWIRVPRAYLASGALLMGLSATPERDDGRGLGGSDGIFDALVVVAQVGELVALNEREPDKGITPIDVFEPAESVRRLAQAPVESYLQNARGRSAAVFAPNVKSAHAFAAGFEAAGIEAPVVHGELALEDRDGALARFARGEIRVLVNVNVLTEGWDAPICDVAILARKIGSRALYTQCVGRARRPYPKTPGKRALLLDLSGNVGMHGHPDEEMVYALEGVACARKGDAGLIRPRLCRSCKRELARGFETQADLGACVHERRPWCPGTELHCPECGTKISKLVVPSPEEVALIRAERDAARAKTPTDKRTKALTTLYAGTIRKSHKREAAHFAYRKMFGHFPPSDVRCPAWKAAIELVASEMSDAWEPPVDDEEDARARA